MRSRPIPGGKKTGAGEGIRTLDPNLGKVVLIPAARRALVLPNSEITRFLHKVVPQEGFEPRPVITNDVLRDGHAEKGRGAVTPEITPTG